MPEKQKTKSEEIDAVIEELKDALIDHEKSKKSEENAKLRTQRTQKRLALAKDALWALEH